SLMQVVDSSGWLEYFTGGPLARRFEPYLSDEAEVLTPSVVLYEVYRLVRRERTEEDALRAIAALKRTTLVPLTDSVAVTAADLALERRLPMAAAIVYATARV